MSETNNEYLGKCFFCNEDAGDSVLFANPLKIGWKYLPMSEQAHADCYIENIINVILKNKENL